MDASLSPADGRRAPTRFERPIDRAGICHLRVARHGRRFTRSSPKLVGAADASHPARPHGRGARVLRHEVRAIQGADRGGEEVHPRRRPAQPRLQLSLPARDREGRGRLPLGRRRQPLHRLSAGGRTDGARQQLRARAREGDRARCAMRAGHGAVPRVRAQAREAHQQAHARGRDVPDARLGHRKRDGRDPRRAHLHRQEKGHQGRRRVPRLERPDGLRPAHSGHAAPGGEGHPARSEPRTRRRCSRTISDALRRNAETEPAARRHRSRHRRAGRARRAARARCTSTTTRRCASCATSSARCSSSTRSSPASGWA